MFHFLHISDIISHRSAIFVSQSETTILLLVDIGSSVVLFLFSVCVCIRSDFLFCSSGMCITPSTGDASRIYSPELLRKVDSDQSFPILRDVRKNLFRLCIWSPRYKYENIFKTENPKPNTPENVMEKIVKTTTVTDVRLGCTNVISLGNKLDCVIDHITDNRLDSSQSN